MLIDDIPPIRPRRRIHGISAVVLPFTGGGDVDWDSFAAHLHRTADAGLTPAVNMEMGAVRLIDEATRADVLGRTREALAGREFLAGVFVADRPGDAFRMKAYLTQIESVARHGGTPAVFQSYGLAHQDAEHIVNDYEAIAACCDRFVVLEQDEQWAPYGRTYRSDVYEALLGIPECIGAVHASPRRAGQWQRIALRDRVRPDFFQLSGNESALDMVTYGSDYLLGISTFAPDWFALRDKLWQEGDARFYEFNDLLQHLAFFAFREPMAAALHSAVQFLNLRGWNETDDTHPKIPRRPDSDRDILRNILIWIETLVHEMGS